jgi:hypothetical protein
MKHETEKEYDFFAAKQKTKTTTVKENELENASIKESRHDLKKTAIAALLAISGLVGIYFKVDYSGWLIFLAFLMIN